MSKYYRVESDKFHYRDISDTTDIDGKITSTTHLNNLGVFRLVVFVIIIITLGGVLSSSELTSFTFRSFLDMLQNAPSIGLNLSIGAWQIPDDWGALNGLKEFLNYNLMPLSFIRFLVVNLINVTNFLFHFLFYIF